MFYTICYQANTDLKNVFNVINWQNEKITWRSKQFWAATLTDSHQEEENACFIRHWEDGSSEAISPLESDIIVAYDLSVGFEPESAEQSSGFTLFPDKWKSV